MDKCVFHYRQSNVWQPPQLLTTPERVVIKSLSTVETMIQCSAVVGSCEEPWNILLMIAKKCIRGLSFKGAIISQNLILGTNGLLHLRGAWWFSKKSTPHFFQTKIIPPSQFLF